MADAINGMLDRLEVQHRRLQEESEAKFQNLVENIPGASYRKSLNGNCAMSDLSRGIADLTGYPAADFLDLRAPRLYADLVHPQDRAIRQPLDGEPVHVWEYRIHHASGEVRWVSERNRVTYDADGHPAHLEGVLFNITEAKKSEQALIEAGKMEISQLPLSPQKIVSDVATFFTAAAKSKNLQIQARCDGAHERIYLGDSLRLRQMLSSLVGNAVKFTDQGHIELQVREVGREGQSALLEFSVSDTGIGIPAEKLALLFQPFSQVDNSDTRKHGGSGLGLSITHHLARLMGGSMGVESHAGQGSRFWFRIRLGLPGADACPGKLEVSSAPLPLES